MSLQKKFPVVGSTVTPGKMLLFTESTYSSFRMMFSCVRRAISKLKVFNSVIGFNFIQMVNNLIRAKVSPKMFFHNQAMLTDVTVSVNKGVFRTPYKNITAISHRFSASPVWVLISMNFSFKVAFATFFRFKSSCSFSRTRESKYLGASRTSFLNQDYSLI